MRRILRRNIVRDPLGRPIASQSERLSDDGAGRLRVNTERTARWCAGCRRPVTELSEMRGVCDWCHTRGCCVHCASRCQICSRQLCGSCRRGFAGPPAVMVCEACRQRLQHRQMLEDELVMEQTVFDRHMEERRLFNQVAALHLNAERMHVEAKLQAARLGMNRQSILRRLLTLLGVAIMKVFQYAGRLLLP